MPSASSLSVFSRSLAAGCGAILATRVWPPNSRVFPAGKHEGYSGVLSK
jgi:hypothetical protein